MAKQALRLSALLASLAVLCLPASAEQKLSGSSAMILRHTERAGGDLLAASGRILYNTVGELAPRSYSSAGAKIQSGYMPLSSQPGSVVSITTVTKSTGILELAWSAPGRDGSLGGVTGGFYRVDYSSDASHVFAPTTFQLEFSTAVAPGAPQRLTISGLLPNTTYYTKIYLADERKFFAEDSGKSGQSTLANAPFNPIVSSNTDTSVTFTWVLPAGGAEAYDLHASSSGGVDLSSRSATGLEVSLTLSGLDPNTPYYFKIASLNWQGDKNFITIIGTTTRISNVPLPVYDVAGVQSPLTRQVTVTWKIRPFVNPAGVVVLLSTSPVASLVADGLSFNPGQALGDNSVVKSTALVTSLSDAGLALDATYFYHLYSFNTALNYSVRVTTAVFLDLPPMAVAGLGSQRSADRSRFTLNWKPATSNLDGSLFASSGAPRNFELDHYEVFRATSVLKAGWVRIATASLTALSYTDVLPDPSQTYLYKVEAVDSLNTRDTAMAMDTEGNLYAFAPDAVTRIQVPPAMLKDMAAETNVYAGDILLRAADQPVDPSNKVFRAARFDAFKLPRLEPLSKFQFSDDHAVVSLRYDLAGGLVVPSGAARVSSLRTSAADANLGLYWDNGAKWVKMFGKVDPADQTVTVQSLMTGAYQIREVVRSQGFHFDVSQISNKAITPNGDGLNDKVVFTFDNPQDSAFSGKVFDTRGRFVSDMAQGPLPNTLQWDGKANNVTVPGAVYVYQIRAEDKVFTGTVVVIR